VASILSRTLGWRSVVMGGPVDSTSCTRSSECAWAAGSDPGWHRRELFRWIIAASSSGPPAGARSGRTWNSWCGRRQIDPTSALRTRCPGLTLVPRVFIMCTN